MRKIFVCLLTLFAFSGTLAYAGAGHSHAPAKPVSEAQALEKATRVVKSFVEKGKIDPSWGQMAPTAAAQKKSKTGLEWLITFDNPKVEDKAKQTLYVFLNLSGEYIAANYSGT